MRLPQHPALPLLSVALLACLCGDIACALLERRLDPHSPPPTARPKTPLNQPTRGGELLALLGANQETAPQLEPRPSPHVEQPTLVGTMESQGQSFALLQSGQEPEVVAVGESYRGFQLLEVSRFRARLRDQAHQEYTLFMNASPTETPAPPPTIDALPYKTSRELRADLDNKGQWIRNILVTPVAQGVQIQYHQSNPLARLGIHSGDIILSLNNQPVQGMDSLPGLMSELRNAQTLNFQIERGGQLIPLTITLDS